MSQGAVTVVQQGGVASVTLSRPDALNCLDEELRSELASALARVADPQVRVVLLTGADGVFATGMEPISRPDWGIASALAAVGKPTVAWIDGDCLDMGLELALACDVRVASERARLGIRHVTLGLLPWDGGTQRLARLVGRGNALRLLLTGEIVSAEEALRVGLVEQVGGIESAIELANRIAEGAPIAASYAKEATLAGIDMSLEQGLRLEADLSFLLHSTADRAEGLRGFAERRRPKFEGR